MSTIASVLAAVTLVVAVDLIVAMIVVRAARRRRQRVRAREEARLRPELVEMLASDDDRSSLPHLTRRQTSLFEMRATELLTKVRGEGRERLATLLVDSGAVDVAERRTRRRGPTGRAAAADFLGTVGRRRSAAAIRPLLRDRSFEVRTAAARALGRLGDATDVPRLLATLEADRPVPFATVADALIQLGAPAVPGLRDGMRSPNVLTRAVCSDGLGLLGAVDAAEDLLAHLHPVEDDEIRIRCARALGWIGTPRAAEPLVRLTSPTEPAPLRATAVRSLGRLGGRTAVATLVPLLDDDVHPVASNAANALLACGEVGITALRDRSTGPGRGAGYAREALARAAAIAPGVPPPGRSFLASEPHLTESPRP